MQISTAPTAPMHQEPDHHHGPEQPADHAGAAPLHQEEAEQHHDGERNDVGIEERRGDLQSLDRAQHRDRRRDHAVAIEERRADQAGGQDEPVSAAAPAGAAERERGQRENAALAPVVGAHDDDDVLQHHHDGERPRDQRQHAKHRPRRDGGPAVEALLDRVERRRPDIAVDDTERAQDQAVAGFLERVCLAVGYRLRHVRFRTPGGPR